MAEEEIRTFMAPITHGHVLLPNSAVAEVLDFTRPEPFKQAPAWLLGELAWRGWQVPVISYELLINAGGGHSISSKSRILVIKTLGESTQVNYIGLVIQGLPKLKKVTAQNLLERNSDTLSETVFSEVTIDDQQAVIPALGRLTRIVEQTAYGG